MENMYKILLQKIVTVIKDKRGCDLVALDVSEFSSITDCVLIAQGNIQRHVTAIAKAVKRELKEFGFTPHTSEGIETGDWAVLDYRQVIVHVFKPQERARYKLEELWAQGKEIPLEAMGA